MDLKLMFFNVWVRCYSYNNKFILRNRRRRKQSRLRLAYDAVLAIMLPWFLLRWGALAAYEAAFGKARVHRLMERERSQTFAHEMGMVAIAKNEGPYIREWIEYHKLVGFTIFYIYDNDSTDNTRQLLQPYIEHGEVAYTFFPGTARQLDAYNDAVARHKDECRWMAFMDLDEFIMPTEPFRPIADVVGEIVGKAGKGAAGVSVNWAVYGSSCFERKPAGLVTENFLNRALPTHYSSYMVKTICNPRMIADCISPHYPLYKPGAYSVSDSDGRRQRCWFCHNVTYQRLRINHYFCKSREEYQRKHARGLADRAGKYQADNFTLHDLNDVHDESMLPYSALIAQKLRKQR